MEAVGHVADTRSRVDGHTMNTLGGHLCHELGESYVGLCRVRARLSIAGKPAELFLLVALL